MALYFCIYKTLYRSEIKKQKKMNFNLTGITKRSKTFHYHISYTWPDGKIRYVEMRREKVEKNRIYLKCTHKTKCTASLFVSFTDQIKTQSTGSRFYKFTEISHRHVGRCFSTITSDGLSDCNKKMLHKLKNMRNRK